MYRGPIESNFSDRITHFSLASLGPSNLYACERTKKSTKRADHVEIDTESPTLLTSPKQRSVFYSYTPDVNRIVDAHGRKQLKMNKTSSFRNLIVGLASLPIEN
jgi:hypothetical protein